MARVLAYTQPMLRGDDVAALQQEIKGFDPKQEPATFVDGVFGPRTRDALYAYQKYWSLRPPHGIATPDFQAAYVKGGAFVSPSNPIGTIVGSVTSTATSIFTGAGLGSKPVVGPKPAVAVQPVTGGSSSASVAIPVPFYRNPFFLAAAAGLAVIAVGMVISKND